LMRVVGVWCLLAVACAQQQFQRPPSYRNLFPARTAGGYNSGSPQQQFEQPDYGVMNANNLPPLPSEMKLDPPRPVALPAPLSPRTSGEWTNDEVNDDLRDVRNFGPPPSLDDIRHRREEQERQRAAALPPGQGGTKTSSRLAQWLPQSNAPREKQQAQLKKVREEMQEMFGSGSTYAQQITHLGDIAIETEVVPHLSAARELKFMDGTGTGGHMFFDVDPNHPIDSAAIQQGVTALEQARSQHKQWSQEEKRTGNTPVSATNSAQLALPAAPAIGNPSDANNIVSSGATPSAALPNLRSMALRGEAPTGTTTTSVNSDFAQGGGIIGGANGPTILGPASQTQQQQSGSSGNGGGADNMEYGGGVIGRRLHPF